MILSDRTIYQYVLSGSKLIEPFDVSRLQPASYDLTLASGFKILLDDSGPIVPGQEVQYKDISQDRIWLDPNVFILAATKEFVCLPDNMIARVEGKSSLGRIGLMVHVTAGFVDPGFRGNITLEIKNVGSRVIQLDAGMSIAQLAFAKLDRNAVRPYGSDGLGSRYQDSEGVVGARA